jgi:hypothetical protein
VWYLVSLLTTKSVFGSAREANADMGVREHVDKVVQLEGTVDGVGFGGARWQASGTYICKLLQSLLNDVCVLVR